MEVGNTIASVKISAEAASRILEWMQEYQKIIKIQGENAQSTTFIAKDFDLGSQIEAWAAEDNCGIRNMSLVDLSRK